MYDSVIIGTGPAGLSAALNLKIRQKNFVWIGTKNLSDKVEKAEKILNYPGMPSISGEELTAAYKKHVEEMNLEITEGMVTSILPMGESFAVLAGSEFYETKTLILATGIVNTALLPGESELVGKGISYCATCDGMLYQNKTIAIICNSARFEHEIKYLADLAKKVYLFATYPNCSIDLPNVEQKKGIREICGDAHIEGVRLQSGEMIPVDGVFCLRNSIAMSTLLPGLELEDQHLKVDRQMQTSIPGCFAAGDCTGRPYQYTKSVGEGNVAAHSVLEYLEEKSGA
jgi:thioredoxin reductase (NADPH)